jgi:hypothetical protein
MMSGKVGLPLIIVVCLVTLCGCTNGDSDPGNSMATGEYVAVQENYLTDCTIITGSYNLPPHITLPNVFIYDGSLNGSSIAGGGWSNLRPEYFDNYYPEVNRSFKALYGTIYYRDLAPGDTSTGVRIRGVYSMPYGFQSGFVLQDIDRNGTVYGSYNNASIVLHRGEQWTSPVFSEVRGGSGTGLDGQHFSYTASFNTTWTVTNLGMFKKSNLTRYKNNASAIGHTMVFARADPSEK